MTDPRVRELRDALDDLLQESRKLSFALHVRQGHDWRGVGRVECIEGHCKRYNELFGKTRAVLDSLEPGDD